MAFPLYFCELNYTSSTEFIYLVNDVFPQPFTKMDHQGGIKWLFLNNTGEA